jgi:hypothetical protein
MTGKNKCKKRIISLGLERPEELDDETIYIDFKYSKEHNQVSATAYSCKTFTHHVSSLNGEILIQNSRQITTYTGGVESSWQLDYNKFIKDLTDSNNGIVENSRLIEDGSRLVTKILESKDSLNEMLSIRLPCKLK